MSDTARYIAESVSEYLVKVNRSHLLDEMFAHRTAEHANERLRRLTGVRCFFPDCRGFDELHQALLDSTMPSLDMRKEREWGDYQTPPALASRVCRFLAGIGISPRIIIEPTYGTGNFILAALDAFPEADLVYGVEIQDQYEWHLKIALLAQALHGRRTSVEIELYQDNVFTHSFPEYVLKAHDILIIGNPPWITNAELGVLGAGNLPNKTNIKGLHGLDAITGKSNFDIGEFILLRLLELFSDQRGTLAMLCKNSVVRNIVEALPRRPSRASNIRTYAIDAKREFGVSVDASLLVMDMGASSAKNFSCHVATLDCPDRVDRVFGWVGNRFVSDITGYEEVSEVDGQSSLTWRQGLKHDCSRVMELDDLGGTLVNGNGETVDVEEQWTYWLLKGSDLRGFEVDRARKKVVVTQHHIGENTSHLRANAPKLWQYLVRNRKYLEKRKSSIYRNRPLFSIFGIGEYSFRPYKVAISGLYKEPRFSLVLPIDGRPVMLDDTCYFLGYNTYQEGLFTASVLSSPIVKQFLRSIVFADSKRPYTKRVLMRIDLGRVVGRLSFDAIRAFWADVGYEPKDSITASDFEDFRRNLLMRYQKPTDLQLGLDI